MGDSITRTTKSPYSKLPELDDTQSLISTSSTQAAKPKTTASGTLQHLTSFIRKSVSTVARSDFKTAQATRFATLLDSSLREKQRAKNEDKLTETDARRRDLLLH